MVATAKRRKSHHLTPLAALDQAAECLKALAHPHRLRIVQMLLRGRYTVGQLAEACEIRSHMASEHLRLMQRCGFLQSERDGRQVYYRVTEPHLANILRCIEDRFDGKRKPAGTKKSPEKNLKSGTRIALS
jgi:DNA-binding transcriptional ArsR family regulator